MFTLLEWALAYFIQYSDTADEIIRKLDYAYDEHYVSVNHLPDYLKRDFMKAYVMRKARSTISPLLLLQANRNIVEADDIVRVIQRLILLKVRVNDPRMIYKLLWGAATDRWNGVIRARVMVELIKGGVDTQMMIRGPKRIRDSPELPLYLHASYYIFAPMSEELIREHGIPIHAMMDLDWARTKPRTLRHFISELEKSEAGRKSREHYHKAVDKVKNWSRAGLEARGISEVLEKEIVDSLRQQQASQKTVLRREGEALRIRQHVEAYSSLYGSIKRLRVIALVHFQYLSVVEDFINMANDKALPDDVRDRVDAMLVTDAIDRLPNVAPSKYSREEYISFVRALFQNQHLEEEAQKRGGWESVWKRIYRIVERLEEAKLSFYNNNTNTTKADADAYANSPLVGITITYGLDAFRDSKAIERIYASFLQRDSWLNRTVKDVTYVTERDEDEEESTQGMTFGAVLMATVFYDTPKLTKVIVDKMLTSAPSAEDVVRFHHNLKPVVSDVVVVRFGPGIFYKRGEFPRRALEDLA